MSRTPFISKKDKYTLENIFYAVVLAWSTTAIFSSIRMSDSWVNIPLTGFDFLLHETGHLMADLFTNSEFIRALSGTLFEFMVIFGLLFILIKSKEILALIFSSAWIAVSFSNLARYMADAGVNGLELYSINPGSGTDIKLLHDWEIIFTKLGLIESSFIIASFVAAMGVVIAVPIWYRAFKAVLFIDKE